MKIDEISLNIRSHNGLKAAGITTLEQLVNLSWLELNCIQNIGGKSVSGICWECVQLLNHKLKEQQTESEEKWPSRPKDLMELKEKADKYDKIKDVIKT